MNLHEIRQQVLAELEHIPRHPKEHQSELRMGYWLVRMHSLGTKATGKKTAAEALEECLADLRKRHPNYVPRYDEAFFTLRNHDADARVTSFTGGFDSSYGLHVTIQD